MSVVGQGTWNLEHIDRKRAIQALRRGIDLGMTHIDTAEMYGRGQVEQIVGAAVSGRRHEVFLVSKVLPDNASRKGTVLACERTLKRLATDYLDCFLLHWPGRHPFAETLAAFEQLEQGGKIRSYGVSNFDVAALTAAVKLAGPGRIACDQVLYHLGQRSIEHALVASCREYGVAVVGYSPFGSGTFPQTVSGGGRVLADVARKYGATARQVALAFLARPEGVFVIPKAADVSHVEENAGAALLQLDAEDVWRVDEAFARGPRQQSLSAI